MDSDPNDPITRRADELFQRHREEIFRGTDRLFAKLMFLQWLAAIVVAVWVSPLTWAGRTSQIHTHVWAAIFLGGAISWFPIWAAYTWPGSAFTRHSIAIGQTLMSTLLIHLTGGRLETHFHIFGSLVILSFYRDWRVLIPATLLVGLDHFFRGVYWPFSAYGSDVSEPWRSVEHTGWVLFEDVFLVISCFRSMQEMRSIARRTAEVEAGEERFRTIFEEAPLGIAVVGLDHRFQQVNARLAQMVGYDRDELHQRGPADIAHPDDVETGEQLVEQLLDGKQPHCSIDKRFLRKDQRDLWVTRTTCVVRDQSGAPRYYLAMIEDITERKEAGRALEQAKEEAERANVAKSEFLSRMSHELRTPLNAILGFGQILKLDPLQPDQARSVDFILKGGQHLLTLINEVLDIARIEAGKMEFSLEVVPVEFLIEDAASLIRPLAEQRNIRLELPPRMEPSACNYAWADMQRTKQVLLNLLSNAIKYNHEGGQVSVLAEVIQTDSGPRVRVSVRDTGPGIAPHAISKLFTPFERLDAEQRNIEGSGIGLALSKRLIEAMGGTIGVTSQMGLGSTFHIELPAADAPAGMAAPDAAPATMQLNNSDGEPRRRTVLQIEDNLANRQLVERLLDRRKDVQLIAAMQGRLGLELAREHRPDLVLLDLHLPDLPGAEVLARLRAEPITRDIPVVVISADATDHQVQRLLSMGAREYLTKPFEISKLLETMDQILAENQRP